MNKQLNYDKHDRATSLIREVVATYIRNEANTNPLITVTNVSVSPDYRKYTVFFTTIPDGREDDALIFLKRSASDIRELRQKAHEAQDHPPPRVLCRLRRTSPPAYR
jgi:ribosome-binding factor A